MFLKGRKGKNNFWRFLVTLFIVLIASQIIGAIPLMVALNQSGGLESSSMDMNEMFANSGLSKNTLLVLMMFPFLVGYAALVWTIKKLHGRTFTDTTTGAASFRWSRFFQGFALWVVLSLILVGISAILMPGSFEWNFQLMPFVILLVISLLFIPFQTGFEEILFRGYLLQGFELLTKNKWAAVILTGLGFSLLHIFNPEVAEFGMGIAMAQYMTFGLLFGAITVLDNGLELAWGTHAANNIFLALFITHDASALQTPAMFRATEINPTMDFISLAVAGVIFLGVCWKLFGWSLTDEEVLIADLGEEL